MARRTRPLRRRRRLLSRSCRTLGAGWTEYQKAEGVQKFPKNDCSVKAGAPVSVSDKGYAGAMYTDATKQMFVYSSATVFRTEADAKAYTAVLNTPAFQTCRVARDDAAQKKANPKTFVKINDTSTSAIGTFPGLEAFYSEYGGNKNSDGSDALSAEYLRYTYRHGRVVYTVKVDASLASDEAGSIELSNRIGEVVGAVNTAVEARLTAAGV